MFKKRREDIERIDCDLHGIAKEVNENRDAIKRLAVMIDKQTIYIANALDPVIRDLTHVQAQIKEANEALRYTKRSNESVVAAYREASIVRSDLSVLIQEVERVKGLLKRLNKDLGNA